MRATVIANNQQVAASGVVWSSSAPSITTVSADGTITGIARGTAQIRGAVGVVSGAVGIEVLGVRALAVQAPRSTLYLTQTMMLTAQLEVDPGVPPSVSWTSSNPGETWGVAPLPEPVTNTRRTRFGAAIHGRRIGDRLVVRDPHGSHRGLRWSGLRQHLLRH